MDKLDAVRKIYDMMGDVKSFQELKAKMEKQGMTDMIDTELMDRIAAEWNAREAKKLPEGTLMQELDFWAQGGSFSSHLKGFNAIPPTTLVTEAKSRGWFVQQMGPKAIVNPPAGKPLILKGIK